MMKNGWAEDFYEIIEALSANVDLSQTVKQLIKSKEIVGKSLEGGDRKQEFRNILLKLVDKQIELKESYLLVERNLSESTSKYRGNKRVFSAGWGERLVRTNLSKFYNQAVLLHIIESGETNCFIPHSKHEDFDSSCTSIAGKQNSAIILLDRMVNAYERGIFSKDIKIPNHPHCTHVVMPIE